MAAPKPVGENMSTLTPEHAVRLMLDEISTNIDTILTTLNTTVNKNKTWDGSIDYNLIHVVRDKGKIMWASYYIPLTFGGLRVRAHSSYYKTDEVVNIASVSYELGEYRGYHGKLLNTNSIMRSLSISDKTISTEMNYRKEVSKKIKLLLAGIEKWFTDSLLNSSSNFWLDTNTLFGNIGKARLCAELLANKPTLDANTRGYMRRFADEMKQLVDRMNADAISFNFAPISEKDA